MPLAASTSPDVSTATAPAGADLIDALDRAVDAVEALFADARRVVAEKVMVDGRPVARVLDREQRAAHGLAWLATYVEAIRQLASYTQRLTEMGSFGEVEELLVRIGAGEYLAQIFGGIPMSQGEIVRMSDLGLPTAAVTARITPAVDHLISTGNIAARRARLVELMRERRDATVGVCGWKRSARRCANSPTARWCRMRRSGTATTSTFRSKSCSRCPSSACSA
jgi:(2S)-methylsuccinyl-CoA dehydrogenase